MEAKLEVISIHTEDDEVYSDQQFRNIKMELTLRRVFKKYREYRDELLYTVVDRMMSRGDFDTQPKRPGYTDKLGNISAYYLDAERYVEFIDSLLEQLDKLTYTIIYGMYIDPTEPTNEDIIDDICQNLKLDLSERTFYRRRRQAIRKMYGLLAQNYDFFKKWQ